MTRAADVGTAIASAINTAEAALSGTETDPVIRDLMMAALATGLNAVLIPEIITNTSAYTLQESDSGKVIETTAAITVPPGLPARWHVLIVNTHTANVNLVKGSSVVIATKDDALAIEPSGAVTIYAKGNNAYRAFGALV